MAADSPSPNWPTIPGHQLLEELGHGGMGIVFKALQTGSGRQVAVKVIRSGTFARPEELSRFRAEGEAVARLVHPNIVRVFEHGEHNGLPFLVMEYVEGGSLGQRLGRAPYAVRQAIELAEVLARTVDHAHQQGIVHRDLNPRNVLLTADGTPKVADFGIAKFLGDDLRLTRTGQVMGTPGYMAPEQAWGRSKEVGPEADVYSLGAILYELLTGRPPFRVATLQDYIDQVRFENPERPTYVRPGLPLTLENICLKCLHKRPYQRYRSAADLADALRAFLDGEPDRPGPPVEPAAGPGTVDVPMNPRIDPTDAGSSSPSRDPERFDGPSGTPGHRTQPSVPPGEGSRPRDPDDGPITPPERGRTWSGADRPEGPPHILGYEILATLGRGGLGTVYKARQVSLNRLVALKVYGEQWNRVFLKHVLVTSRAVARLHHPNILQLYECGEQSGLVYVAQELIEGPSLNRAPVRGARSPREVAELVETLARAVCHFHRFGIIHRNLKPQVILLTPVGVPKISSFEMAKVGEFDTEQFGEEGQLVGTPLYMAPEQAGGRQSEVGPATDIYALGAILYEMLTGQPPFRGPSVPDLLHQVVSREPVPPAQLRLDMPRALEQICLRCLRKSPRQRYASAEALADDLRQFVERGESVGTRRLSAIRLAILISIAGIASVVGWAVAYLLTGQR